MSTNPSPRAASVTASASANGNDPAQSTTVRTAEVTPCSTSPAGTVRQWYRTPSCGSGRVPCGTVTWTTAGRNSIGIPSSWAAVACESTPRAAAATARAGGRSGRAYSPRAARTTSPRARALSSRRREVCSSNCAARAWPPNRRSSSPGSSRWAAGPGRPAGSRVCGDPACSDPEPAARSLTITRLPQPADRPRSLSTGTRRGEGSGPKECGRGRSLRRQRGPATASNRLRRLVLTTYGTPAHRDARPATPPRRDSPAMPAPRVGDRLVGTRR